MSSTTYLGIFLGIFSLFESITSDMHSKNKQKRPYDYVDMAYDTKSEVDLRISKQYGYSLFGSGGSMYDCVREISTSFNARVKEPLTVEEARKLILPIAIEYLKAFNSNEEIRPYLLNYPFNSKNLHIAVFFNDLQGYEYWYPDLSVVSVSHGNILYYGFNKSTDTNSDKWEYKETFEEGVERLKQQL